MRHPSFRLSMSAVLAAALLLAGCATVERDKRAIALEAGTTGYQAALRWGYFENAVGYLHPDIRKDKPSPEILQGLRVTGYDVVQAPAMQDKDSATQVVLIEYLFEDRQVVKQVTDRQIWVWDPEVGSWWLKSGLPNFR